MGLACPRHGLWPQDAMWGLGQQQQGHSRCRLVMIAGQGCLWDSLSLSHATACLSQVCGGGDLL